MEQQRHCYPTSVNILGIIYTVEYHDKPSEVDIFKRKSLWGQIDYWTRTIRIYDNGGPAQDVWQTIIHEVLHGILTMLHLDKLYTEDAHDEMGSLALALADVFIRNGWLVGMEGKGG